MGSVFRAHDARLHRKVAIKILTASASSVESHNRLLNEARISARLNHPNIVSVYDADEAQGLAFIVMEYVVGQNLREAAPDSQEEILQIVGQICTALAYAHTQGVIHRDLKPENIMLTSGMVKLMDFGLARSIREDRPSDSKVLVGTPVYMAPVDGFVLYLPSMHLCTDNAAMVAAAGYHHFIKGNLAKYDLNSRAYLPLVSAAG